MDIVERLRGKWDWPGSRVEAADEIARLRAEVERARTLILSAPLFMHTWPENVGRDQWVRDSQKWLAALAPDGDERPRFPHSEGGE